MSRFYATYGIDPDLVSLSECFPDLLMVDDERLRAAYLGSVRT